MEVPVLWLRVDPEYQWLRQLSIEQPDTIWQSMLRYERDPVAQIEVSQSVSLLLSHSVTQSLTQSLCHSLTHSLSQSITQSVSQSVS